jgi:hypothetical protein
MACFLVMIVLGTLFALMQDLLEKGCLAWHRDSLGILLQKMTFAICLLFTFVYLFKYVKAIENNEIKPGSSIFLLIVIFER